MGRIAITLGAGCVISVTLAAQQSAPTFEVASVRRNVTNAPGRSVQASPTTLTIINVPVRMLLRDALKLQDAQIIGGPDWVAAERYDITAKFNEKVRPQVDQILEAVLKDRFKLMYHKETRVLPVYALVRSNSSTLGPNIRATVVDCGARAAANRAGRGTGADCGFDRSAVSLRATGMDLASVAATLSQIAGRIVVDKTDLTGQYELELKWADFSAASADALADGGSLFTAVQEQLGLKLQSDRAPVEVVVIDSAERPTPN
jgi:uncharacterized protein (TIGR03435 family)